MRIWPGNPYPIGATWDGGGVNFALFTENATGVDLCLFDRDGWSARAVSLIEKATWRSSRRLGSSRSTGRDPLPRAGQASSTIWPLVRRASRSRCASAAAARG